MISQNITNTKANKMDLLFAVVALGSVCGLLEVIVGGFLHQIRFAYRVALLTGLGFGVIGFGLAIFRKPFMAIWIGLVAVLCKQMVVVILHVSVMCKLNSCLAVLFEYGALSGIAVMAMSRIKGNTGIGMLTGGSAALIGSVAFYFVGMRVAPCNYLLSFNHPGGFVAFLLNEGLIWAAFSAILFPLGWLTGEKFIKKTYVLLAGKPQLFYIGTALTTIFCWAICAIAISRGI
jgi:hypothetical protein